MRNILFYLLFTISFSSFGNDLSGAYTAMRKVYEEGTVSDAKEEALKFLSLAKHENDAYYLVKTYFLLGYLASHSEDYGNAIIYYLEGARFAEQADHEDAKTTLIYICKNLGRILGDYKHYELSEKFINQGLKVAQKLNNQDQIKSLLNNRVHELLEQEKFTEALHEIDSLRSLFNLEGAFLFKMYNKAGIAYQNTGNYQLALENYEQVLLKGRTIAPEIYVMALQNTGTIYFQRKKYETALSYFKEQVEIAKTENFDQLLFQAYEMLGETYTLLGDNKNATNFLKKAAMLDNEEKHLEPATYTVYEKLSRVYEQTGDIQQALHYKKIYARKLEAFIAEQKKIEELDKRYNIQLLTERYFDLLAANKKQERTERIAAIGAGAIILIFLLIIFNIYYKQYRVKHSIKQELKKIQLMDLEL